MRILAVISHPPELPQLDFVQEEAILRDGLAEWIQRDRLQLEICKHATIPEITKALRRFRPHIFHFIGHGNFDRSKPKNEKAYLLLQNEDGSARPVSDQSFRELFGSSKETRIVVLNACNTATLSASQALAGFAPHLLYRNIAAVVAMQYPIDDRAALIFSREFYRSLVLNFPLEQAVSEARRGIKLEMVDSTTAWGAPVLFLRAKDGQIFKIEREVSSTAPRLPPPPNPTKPPIVANFVGRQTELIRYKASLRKSGFSVIAGMAGVGKTALAAQIAWQFGEPEKTFWHTFRRDEGFEVIIWQLAGFLAWHEHSDLWQMLQTTIQNGGSLPPPEVLFDYLFQLIRRQGYLLCFDDFHHVDGDPVLQQLVERLRPAVLASEIYVLITSRHVPEFVYITAHEPLAGLSFDDTQRLLRAQDVDLGSGLLEQLYERIDGNAELLMLTIELLRSSNKPITLLDNLVEIGDIQRYLLTEVDRSLEEPQRQVMNGVAALIEYPGTRDAIAEVLEGRDAWYELAYLTNRYLLQLYDGNFQREYGQHPILQAFYYDMLSPNRRREMHRRAGEYYESSNEADMLKAALHYERAGEYQRAAQLAVQDIWFVINSGHSRGLKELLKKFKTNQIDELLWIEVTLALGQICTIQGEGEKARHYYETALNSLEASPVSIEVQLLLALACRGMGESLDRESPKDAAEWFSRGLSLLPEADISERASLLISLGTVQMYMGAYMNARQSLEHGLSLLPEKPSQHRITALLNLDSVYFYQGDLEQAKTYALQALTASQALRDQFKVAEALGNLGLVKYVSGDWGAGVKDFQAAFDIAEQLGYKKFMAHIVMNLGTAYLNLGDDDLARQYLMRSLEWADQNSDRATEGIAQFRLADLSIKRQQYDAAILFLQKAEKNASEIEDLGLLHSVYSAYAETALALTNTTQVQAYIDKALALAERVGEAEEEGITQRILGRILVARGNLAAGTDMFRTSLVTLQEQDPYEFARTQVELAIALFTSGQRQEGHHLLQEAKDTFISLGAKRDIAHIEKLQGQPTFSRS